MRFCTPGLVMAIAGHLLNGGDPGEAIAGNLCRCTSGVPIRRLLPRLAELQPPALPDLTQRLRSIPPHRRTAAGGRIVAGGTDLFAAGPPAATDQHIGTGTGRLTAVAGSLRVPAAMTVADFRSAAGQVLPEVAESLGRFGSEAIRHRATVGGNLVSASPIGDLGCILLALRARVVLRDDVAGTDRTLPLEAFWTGYRSTALHRAERVDAVLVPVPGVDTRVSVEKVSRREQVDVASVNSACAADVVDGGLRDVRISAGGVAPTVVLLTGAAQALQHAPLTTADVLRAASVAAREVAPISDVRGSEAYKRLLLQHLIVAHVERLLPGTVSPEDLP